MILSLLKSFPGYFVSIDPPAYVKIIYVKELKDLNFDIIKYEFNSIDILQLRNNPLYKDLTIGLKSCTLSSLAEIFELRKGLLF